MYQVWSEQVEQFKTYAPEALKVATPTLPMPLPPLLRHQRTSFDSKELRGSPEAGWLSLHRTIELCELDFGDRNPNF